MNANVVIAQLRNLADRLESGEDRLVYHGERYGCSGQGTPNGQLTVTLEIYVESEDKTVSQPELL